MNQVKSTVNIGNTYDRGLTGHGIGIAVVDTGLSPHPDCRLVRSCEPQTLSL